MEHKKVLVIEDDEFLRSLTAKRLEKEGYGVLAAVDGESGLAMAGDQSPNLILLDLLLPGLNGFEVLQKLKAASETKKIPVIVFSNLGQHDDIEKARNLGADDFLIKANFTLDDVINKINGVLK
jgi:DNA-binding response OmpR family regulator